MVQFYFLDCGQCRLSEVCVISVQGQCMTNEVYGHWFQLEIVVYFCHGHLVEVKALMSAGIILIVVLHIAAPNTTLSRGRTPVGCFSREQ